jgi:hypothetical protein
MSFCGNTLEYYKDLLTCKSGNYTVFFDILNSLNLSYVGTNTKFTIQVLIFLIFTVHRGSDI